MPARPHNLPPQLSSFIGRERELAEVKGLLASARLVTLTGAGGCGKTRLAMQAAAGVLNDFSHGVWFVDFATLTEPGLVAQQLATTLHVGEQPAQALSVTLTNYLRGKSVLLLLDNCEHVLEAGTPLVDSLLRACPRLRILATSREPLNVEGEQVYRVSPLQIPNPDAALPLESLEQNESIRLFVDRATHAHAHFALGAQNAEAVARICQRLDGIPLAIELAAARVNVLSVQQIAARLDDALGLLTRGSPPSARHQTMRAALDWSYNLLPERERVLFRRLAVFAGAWSLAAAEHVCMFDEPRLDADGLDVLTNLIERSLVLVSEHEEIARYRLLEPVRQYARGKLEEARETERLGLRHLEFFLRAAEEAAPELYRGQQQLWFRRLDSDYDNLRAALAWAAAHAHPSEGLRLAIALGWYWFVRGYWNDGYRCTIQFLGSIDRLGLFANAGPLATGRAGACGSAGWFAFLLGRQSEALSLLSESMERSRALGPGSERVLSFALGNLAFASQESDIVKARLHAEENLQVARALDEAWLIARAQNLLCLVMVNEFVLTQQSDLRLARRLAEDSLRLWRSAGDRMISSRALATLGLVAFYQGDLAAARAYAEEEIASIYQLGETSALPNALERLAGALEGQGLYAEAGQKLEESLQLYQAIGARRSEAQILCQLGDVARKQNHVPQAMERYTRSIRLALESAAHNMVWICLVSLAAVAAEQRADQHAIHCLAQADALLGNTAEPVRTEHAYAQAAASLRAQFAKAAFAPAWRAGRAMTLEQVVGELERSAGAAAASLAHQATAATRLGGPAGKPAGPTSGELPAGLSAREAEVLRLLALGLTNQEIADQLVLSRRTVHAHLRSIYGKIDVTTRNAATRVALELKLV